MKFRFSGTVRYANDDPVQAVSVRVYDEDTAGKQDDDLTATPGLSDEQGRFSLTYEPLRYLDYHTIDASSTLEEPFDAQTPGIRLPDLGDIYLPYLKFNYTVNGLARQHSTPLGLFQKTFHLPENPPLEFVPSVHGFKFANSFSGYFLPFSTPAFMGASKVPSNYGLCGGMCAAAYDFALTGRIIPQQVDVPRQGTRLQRYLFRRQIDSLGGIGQQIVKVAQWTGLPDDTPLGTQARTAVELESIRQKLDAKNLVPLALIYEHATSLTELARVIFNNHQVLAFAYQQDSSGVFSIQVYDPNLPGRDDVTIHSAQVTLGEVSSPEGQQEVIGIDSAQMLGSSIYRVVRGFFEMPYTPVKPVHNL